MRKSGFTLIEILAAIVILGIIMAIAIPAIQDTIAASKEKLYDTTVTSIKKLAKDYLLKYGEEIEGLRDTGTGKVSIVDLLNKGVLTSRINNPITNKYFDDTAFVTITKLSSGNYNYSFALEANPPTVAFETNGNSTYAKSRSITVTATDDTEINSNSLKYQWTTSTSTPTEASFSSIFTNGGTITSPSGATGGYYLWILAKDTSSNKIIARTNIFNLDNTAPAITMLGSSPVTIILGSTYTDAGATATDNIDGNVTNNIQITSTVNTDTVGSFVVTYNVSDSSGNNATAIVRTVNVIETIAPTVAFGTNGNTTYAKSRSTTTTVSDNYAVDTSSFKYQWTTSTTAPTEGSFSTSFTNVGTITSPAGVAGGYYLWILAKDTSGNTTIARTNVFNIDNTIPVITMLGSSPVNINPGSTYSDAGATATDNIDGNITSNIQIISTLDTNTIGSFTVTYNVSDSSGNNAAAVTRTINVVDTIAPTVAFGTNGNTTFAKSRSTTATVSDNYAVDTGSLKYQWTTSTTAPTEGSFSTSFTNGGTITSPSGVAGGYYLWILAKDTSGNTTIARTNVFNLDNAIPIITMLGSSPVNINPGSTYTDAGATATDIIDGTLTSSISTVSTINVNTVGSYTVTYNVSDSSGNAATAVVRTVNVVDTIAPTVAFGTNGNTTYAKSRNTTTTVSDNYAVDTGSLKYQWTTSTTAPTEGSFSTSFTNGGTITSPSGVAGGYYLWILAKDTSGNTTITGSNVFNLDNTVPVITMLGSSPVNINPDSTYTDSGATATDNVDGTLTASISTVSTVNVNTVGSYTVTYNVSDSSGNNATAVVRTVNVADTVAPTVAFGTNGNSTYAKSRSTTVTASDNYAVDASSLKYQWTTSTTTPTEGSFSTTFTSGGTISTPGGVTGGYYLWILAKDTFGNTTIARTNVFNIDNIIPVITMLGSSPATVLVGNTYTDAGATVTDNIDGILTSSINTVSTVNVNTIGSYTVTYNVSDSSGNAATTVVRTINVVDTTPPVVAFNPNGNSTYAKSRSLAVTVTDNVSVNNSSVKYQWTTSTTAPTEASFSTTFINGGVINSPVGATGSYYLWILGKDTSGNTTIMGSNVFNLDNAAPVITMLGSSPISTLPGSIYTDAGATAADNIDGTLTSSINIVSTVNVNTVGSYTVTYDVGDSSGNAAVTVTRTVNVIETTPPTIAFGTNGNSTYAKSRSTTVTVSDNYAVDTNSLKYQWTTSATTPAEGSFSTSFTNGGTISTSAGVTGGYYLWILAKDTSGNTTITGSNVFNLDNTAPVITLTGSTPIGVALNGTYTDGGATAVDGIDGTLTSSIVTVNSVNAAAVGTYTVTYNVSDSSGNTATQVTRTVKVVGATTFAYTGASQTFTVPVNGTYKIEVWGAAGGSSTVSGCTGGLGGYAYGNISLTTASTVYVYVGGSGVKATSSTATGGWNGGGTAPGNSTSTYQSGSGGGATDVRVSGTALANRVIVGGGGGGSGSKTTGYTGGAGGGTTGSAGAGSGGTGGSSATGGTTGGASGTGGNGATTSRGGGGGGYYGGGSGQVNYYGGGGGSSYYGGMIAGTTGTTAAIRSGAGTATITYVGP